VVTDDLTNTSNRVEMRVCDNRGHGFDSHASHRRRAKDSGEHMSGAGRRKDGRSAGRAGGRASRVRITGGEMTGLRLRVPDVGVRPTSDRVRESLFARLGDLQGLRVLDLFAGSGALGFEAVSRGAQRVVFVDRAHAVIAVLQENLATHSLEDRCKVIRGDAQSIVRRLSRDAERFDLVLLDPPYASLEIERVLPALLECDLLSDSCMVVVETAKRHAVAAVDGLCILDERDYGDTRITRLTRAPTAVGSAEK